MPNPLTQAHIRWRNSLIFRVILLCGILLLCLLGSVYVITQHFFSTVVREMESQTQRLAEEVSVLLEREPRTDLEDMASLLSDPDREVTIERGNLLLPLSVGIETDEAGQFYRVARTMIESTGGPLLLSVRVPMTARTEVFRAFQNKTLLLVTAVFLIALGLMIYVIARTLKPLRELSDTCAEISEGNLKPLEVRKTYDEIESLEQTFNRMVTSLQEKEVVEAKLRQAQRLSALGNLAAGVAHDVRNPLNAIKLLSSHALDNLGNGADPARAATQLETIRAEVDHIEEIVSGFLSLAKERELRPEPSRIDELLDECVRLIKKDAESRRIRLIADLRAGDTTLMLDPKQWTRAILNVLINAMEACPEDGRVRLFSRRTDQTLEIEVRDDGPGMSKDEFEHCFDPYFTTKPTGTGLGLSITRGIVEEHGASIQLTSEPDRGCQVLIVFPLEAKVL